MGDGEDCLNPTHQSGPRRQAAPVRVPAGTAVSVTSVNRLVAKSSHPAAHVEAPAPNTIMRLQTSKRTLTPAWATTHRLAADMIDDERAARSSLFSGATSSRRVE
jgi:hypothetical protein